MYDSSESTSVVIFVSYNHEFTPFSLLFFNFFYLWGHLISFTNNHVATKVWRYKMGRETWLFVLLI
jgi:hypothetical protein